MDKLKEHLTKHFTRKVLSLNKIKEIMNKVEKLSNDEKNHLLWLLDKVEAGKISVGEKDTMEIFTANVLAITSDMNINLLG